MLFVIARREKWASDACAVELAHSSSQIYSLIAENLTLADLHFYQIIGTIKTINFICLRRQTAV